MRKILVTAISGNVSNGILKALLDTDDIVYGCDIYDYPVGMDKVVKYWKSDMATSDKYIKNLLTKCKEYEITHLIPVNELEIREIRKNLLLFEEAGISVIINNPCIIDTFLDKYKTAHFLKKLDGIYVPDTCFYRDFVEDGKQYIVKLNNSCGSKLLKIFTKKQELDELGINENECVIQEYIDEENEEYTVGVFSDGIQVSTIIFKRKLEHGYTSFVELVEDESIEKMAEKIAKEIDLKGYINIQLRKHDTKNYIFEINPRISGTVYFRHMLGFKDVIWWLNLLDGKEVKPYICTYSKAVGMRELSEKYVELLKK